MKRCLRLAFVGLLMGSMVGCVVKTDVTADAQLREQAMQAFEDGNYARVKRLVAQADRYYVPQSKLWRKTLSLRVAIAEDSQRGELREFLKAWGEQRNDWSFEDKISAELTLAETLQSKYAANWLYDLDPTNWKPALRTRHHLLLSQLERENPALRDDATARWLKGIRGMYERGDVSAAASQALKCAKELQSASAALIAAKLYNELYNASRKDQALTLAVSLSAEASVKQEANLIRSAPLGTRSTF